MNFDEWIATVPADMVESFADWFESRLDAGLAQEDIDAICAEFYQQPLSL